MKRKVKIAILFGGPSSERVVSLCTAKKVFEALDRARYIPCLIKIDAQKRWYISSGAGLSDLTAVVRLKKLCDVAFIAMHGSYGEDGTIQSILDAAGIPYTGSGVIASAVGMDKMLSYRLFRGAGIPTPSCTEIVGSDKKNIRRDLKTYGFPLVIKPVNGGSSVGVHIVKNTSDALHAIRSVQKYARCMAQVYIPGRELTCAVLDDGRGNVQPLPPTEIISNTGEFFDYQAKYTIGGAREITPAPLPKKLMNRVQAMAVGVHRALGCSGMSRTDMRLTEDGKLFVLEINTIPGMTETSLLPQAARAAGIPFPKLLDLIIKAGLRKFGN